MICRNWRLLRFSWYLWVKLCCSEGPLSGSRKKFWIPPLLDSNLALSLWCILKFFSWILVVVYCFFACLNHLFSAVDLWIGRATLGDLAFLAVLLQMELLHYTCDVVVKLGVFVVSCCQCYCLSTGWEEQPVLQVLAQLVPTLLVLRLPPGQSHCFSVSERFLPPVLEKRILQCQCHCWKKAPFLWACHLNYRLKQTVGCVGDVGVAEVLLCPARLGVRRRARSRKMSFWLLAFSRKNAVPMWVEGGWVVLLGCLGNTAFM